MIVIIDKNKVVNNLWSRGMVEVYIKWVRGVLFQDILEVLESLKIGENENINILANSI